MEGNKRQRVQRVIEVRWVKFLEATSESASGSPGLLRIISNENSKVEKLQHSVGGK
jgi:hypothetical protein